LGDAVAVIELARYQEGPASVVVSRDGDDLVFWSSYDDYGRTITEESRIVVADFVAKGEGPWPWYDLGDERDGTLMVLDALGVDRRSVAGRSGAWPLESRLWLVTPDMLQSATARPKDCGTATTRSA
jgi:hypothetical protein